jgi:hypothetical protein
MTPSILDVLEHCSCTFFLDANNQTSRVLSRTLFLVTWSVTTRVDSRALSRSFGRALVLFCNADTSIIANDVVPTAAANARSIQNIHSRHCPNSLNEKMRCQLTATKQDREVLRNDSHRMLQADL